MHYQQGQISKYWITRNAAHYLKTMTNLRNLICVQFFIKPHNSYSNKTVMPHCLTTVIYTVLFTTLTIRMTVILMISC